MMRKLFSSLMVAALAIGVGPRPAFATKVFVPEFAARYVPKNTASEADLDWAKSVKKAKCYVCHVKGKPKEFRNTYGDALSKYLDHDHFSKERCEAEPEKVKQEIQSALEKVEPEKDASGIAFGDLFKAQKLPDKKLGPVSIHQPKKEGGDEDEDDE